MDFLENDIWLEMGRELSIWAETRWKCIGMHPNNVPSFDPWGGLSFSTESSPSQDYTPQAAKKLFVLLDMFVI